MKREQRIPTPDQLLAKAKALPRGVTLSDYLKVMWTLKDEKGYSLREIAAWLSDQLKVEVTHMQVYRAMNASLPHPDEHGSKRAIEETESRRGELEQEASQ